MGCVPDKIIRQQKDNHPNTQNTQPRQSIPANPHKNTPIKPQHRHKQAVGSQTAKLASNVPQSGVGDPTTSKRNQWSEQIIKKYRITVKQNMYRTNGIHSYSYKPLVCFNPPVDSLFTTEKDILDRSYNINFSKELSSQTKIMLYKK